LSRMVCNRPGIIIEDNALEKVTLAFSMAPLIFEACYFVVRFANQQRSSAIA